MSDLFEEPDDATPLAPAKRDALLQTWIMDRDDLNEAEQENIVKGAARAGKRRGKPADSAFIRSASFTNSSRGIRVGILILRMEGWRRKAYDGRAGELERLPAVYDHCAPTNSTTGLTNTLSGWHNIARRSPRASLRSEELILMGKNRFPVSLDFLQGNPLPIPKERKML
ncbi:hypothetical protein [Bradyrhizobium valentinum]|uniref:hypothetical protein n=1 Tax=Bradyrhizobium valentinum TaxID=1518501 RepID=UPI001FD96340|nr:hypothetical protein [Bradyrhizobium valentinum]